MGLRHRRHVRELSRLLLAMLLLPWGCTPQAARSSAVSSTSPIPSGGTIAVQGADALPPTASQARVRQLEQNLAERDRQIAAVRNEIDTARGAPASDQPASPGPHAAAPLPAAGQALPSPVQVEPAAAEPAGRGLAAGSPAPVDAAPDPRLVEAKQRIVRLERQLATEVKRRREVEAEMDRLLRETSAGPFEQANSSVEQHLREQLDRARREVGDLRKTLAGERRERDEIERRYTVLQAQVRAAGESGGGASNEEIEALKERQRRVLASIQRDLEASRQREAELRRSVEEAQGADGVAMADTVTTLRSENSALQIRLDEEHNRNRDLSAKLQFAARVTDLIYKMQTAGVQPVAVAPMAP